MIGFPIDNNYKYKKFCVKLLNRKISTSNVQLIIGLFANFEVEESPYPIMCS